MLSAILRQNPRFHAAMTSPVGGLFNQLVESMSGNHEGSEFISNQQRQSVLRGLFHSYYGASSAEVIFDTNRMWCSRLHTILRLFPEAKVIACVRNPAWVMDSVERLVRENAFENSRMFATPQEQMTVYSRVDALSGPGRFVGFPYYALKQAYFSDEAESMLLIDYDLLCREPAQSVSLIYQFLGEEPFAHDFDNLEYQAKEFDRRLGMDGLHDVKKKVEYAPRKTILPPDLFERFQNQAFWTQMNESKASVIAPAPAQPALV